MNDTFSKHYKVTTKLGKVNNFGKMSPKRKRPIEDVGGPSTHESADAKPVKVKWDDAKDKLLFSKLILVLHIGEVPKELWEWVASLMGGDKQGFTASTVRYVARNTLQSTTLTIDAASATTKLSRVARSSMESSGLSRRSTS